ncbi:hypothetical protein [Serratia marcescens]|uniref:hypothetical protein n=1 Tax=Serratia marcescens TaxID=615 RepID=UPI00066A605D|nr:hypothetical protein [Serratia marcescens]ELY1861838.1 hypothetical protein [Serratia marcescens]
MMKIPQLPNIFNDNRVNLPSQREASPVATVENLLQRGANLNDPGVDPTGFSSIHDLRDFVRNNPLPNTLYRAHFGEKGEIDAYGLERSDEADKKRGDDYLADIIKHTARTGGSGGAVLSLSGSLETALRFATNRIVVQIDATAFPGRFKSTAQILLEDADRLMAAKKVSPSTVRKALENLRAETESEAFYLDGDIPRSAVKKIY